MCQCSTDHIIRFQVLKIVRIKVMIFLGIKACSFAKDSSGVMPYNLIDQCL
jgi:hypothetical protein